MLRIRLQRTGKSNSPSYRVVVAERSAHPQSNGKETLGQYVPSAQPKVIDLKEDRIEYWLDQGAQPSTTVKNLLIEEGIMEGEKQNPVSISDRRKEELEEQRKAEEEEEEEESEEVEEKQEELEPEESKDEQEEEESDDEEAESEGDSDQEESDEDESEEGSEETEEDEEE